MPKIGTPGRTVEVLQKYQFNFQKKYGQNFLIEPQVLETIVDAAHIQADDCVLEIGPGIGTMTQYLAEQAREVVAVEIDKALIPILQDTLSEYPNVTIINEDILKVDLEKLVKEKNDGRPVKVVANLPYYITTPIIMQLFESHVPLHSITIMVQTLRWPSGCRWGREQRLRSAFPGGPVLFPPEIITHVPPTCFIPRPNVGSTVIRLTRYEKPPVEAADESFLFSLIRASFNQRRKTLVNGLSNASGLNLSKAQITEALEQMGLPANVRGETFTLEQFARLSELLYRKK